VTVDKVADASALAALLFNEPESGLVERALINAVIYAPAIVEFEIANVCWKKCRRHPDQVRGLLAALGKFAAFDVQMLPVDLQSTVDLALRFGLTAYDASYLFVANAFEMEVVTLDTKLADAAKRCLPVR
jgi:predicted nucleic acid-binding protein